MARIGFIGLGIMGYPMAGHLAQAGHQLTVYNRSPEKAHQWQTKYNGHAVDDLNALLSTEIDFLISCVGNDIDLDNIGSSISEKLSSQTLWIDHTTASARLTCDLANTLAENQITLIDAPVSGGEEGAQKGALTIMCGGDAPSYERALPIMNHYAKSIQRMGPSGHGQLTKMVNQIAVTGVIQSLAESLNFASNVGLDPLQVMSVISKGAAQSWQMDNRHKTMIEGNFDFGFSVDWMKKDLDICLHEANQRDIKLPITEIIKGFYEELQQNGQGKLDTSALINRLTDH